ncbi:MAG: hypothetical protein HYX76_02260 [Acidobacteria bacterium]|nr:hypothetical protein [Acidobacteriota bacterium]
MLFNLLPDFDSTTTGRLFCFEQNGVLRWQVPHGREILFRGRPFGHDFVGTAIHSVEVGGRRLLLTVAGHRRWAPCQVALLDPRTGRLVEEFWHPGTLTHTLLHDLDQDGRQEVVLASVNNPGQGPGRPVLLVLDLPFSRNPIRADSLLALVSAGFRVTIGGAPCSRAVGPLLNTRVPTRRSVASVSPSLR